MDPENILWLVVYWGNDFNLIETNNWNMLMMTECVVPLCQQKDIQTDGQRQAMVFWVNQWRLSTVAVFRSNTTGWYWLSSLICNIMLHCNNKHCYLLERWTSFNKATGIYQLWLKINLVLYFILFPHLKLQ